MRSGIRKRLDDIYIFGLKIIIEHITELNRLREH